MKNVIKCLEFGVVTERIYTYTFMVLQWIFRIKSRYCQVFLFFLHRRNRWRLCLLHLLLWIGVQSYNKECIVDGFRFLSHHESRETSERQKAKIPSEKFTGNVVSIGTWDDAFRIKGSIDKNSSKNVQWHLYVFRGVKWISRRKKNKKKCYWYRSLCHVELLILTWHPKTKNQRRKNTHRQTKNAWRSWRASEKHRERETNERKQKTIHEK